MLTSLTKQAPVLFVFITLIAPVIEEIVFRKVLFGGLTNWMNIHVAAVISSLFFALGHGDLPFLLVYFSIGLILCFLYTKTKRITVTIFAHMIMNAIVLLFSLGGVS
ncbi:CPBP family intramembrane glutamic endopeptidase [Listeria grayi]